MYIEIEWKRDGRHAPFAAYFALRGTRTSQIESDLGKTVPYKGLHT